LSLYQSDLGKIIQGHWPNVINIIFEQTHELNKFRDPIYFYDNLVRVTYILTKIEPTMLMVCCFLFMLTLTFIHSLSFFKAEKWKKKDKGDTTLRDINHIANSLRMTKLFDQLKWQCSIVQICILLNHILCPLFGNRRMLNGRFSIFVGICTLLLWPTQVIHMNSLSDNKYDVVLIH